MKYVCRKFSITIIYLFFENTSDEKTADRLHSRKAVCSSILKD
ncbi:hypothetical protein D920_00365 [Enterococcus faecalis 13-SD-W-01]|nr:hypothetical protein D920_00365 [Enterococcus faecalis 13-SD-W-01]